MKNSKIAVIGLGYVGLPLAQWCIEELTLDESLVEVVE